MVNRFERFLFDLSEIYRCWHWISSEEMKKFGLKGPYAVYLTTLYQYPDGVTSMKLSELCGRNKADVSRAMNSFEEKGIVVRDNENPYRALIRLTDEGKRIAAAINEKVMSAVSAASQGVSDEEREIMYRSLEAVMTNLKEYYEQM